MFISETHELLKKHNETMKQQHDLATKQVGELEEERKTLTKTLKSKESKLAGNVD